LLTAAYNDGAYAWTKRREEEEGKHRPRALIAGEKCTQGGSTGWGDLSELHSLFFLPPFSFSFRGLRFRACTNIECCQLKLRGRNVACKHEPILIQTVSNGQFDWDDRASTNTLQAVHIYVQRYVYDLQYDQHTLSLYM
jgi:hypothetical protein